MKRSISYLG